MPATCPPHRIVGEKRCTDVVSSASRSRSSALLRLLGGGQFRDAQGMGVDNDGTMATMVSGDRGRFPPDRARLTVHDSDSIAQKFLCTTVAWRRPHKRMTDGARCAWRLAGIISVLEPAFAYTLTSPFPSSSAEVYVSRPPALVVMAQVQASSIVAVAVAASFAGTLARRVTQDCD